MVQSSRDHSSLVEWLLCRTYTRDGGGHRQYCRCPRPGRPNRLLTAFRSCCFLGSSSASSSSPPFTIRKLHYYQHRGRYRRLAAVVSTTANTLGAMAAAVTSILLRMNVVILLLLSSNSSPFGLSLLGMTVAEAAVCSPADADVVVSDLVTLADLVERTTCSGGVFRVSWRGALTLTEPLVVGNSTSLTVKGMGSEAAMDGGGSSRIIQVMNTYIRSCGDERCIPEMRSPPQPKTPPFYSN